MKKQALLFAVLASVFSVKVYAGNTYVGAGLGIQSITAETSKLRGWRPGLFIGYGGRVDEDNPCFYLAGEFAVSWVGANSDSYKYRYQSLRIAPEFSISLIPGMVLQRYTMGYLRFGFGEGKQPQNNEWLRAAIVGAGVEYDLSPCWALRGEVDYSQFRAISSLGTPKSWDGTLSLKYTYDV